MDTEATISLVDVVLDYQYDMLCVRNSPWGVNHAEFLFVEAARLITSDPGLREWTISAVEYSILQGYEANGGAKSRPKGSLPHEFIMFLVHYTRWSEFSSLAIRLRDSPVDTWRSNPCLTWSQQLDAALQDDWEDREFYASFNHA